MCCLDIVRLSVQVQDTITVPVVTPSRNQILVLSITQRCLITMIANVFPDIDIAVDEGETRRRDVEGTIAIVPGRVGPRSRNGVAASGRESPVTPLLSVIYLNGPRDERGSGR